MGAAVCVVHAHTHTLERLLSLVWQRSLLHCVRYDNDWGNFTLLVLPHYSGERLLSSGYTIHMWVSSVMFHIISTFMMHWISLYLSWYRQANWNAVNAVTARALLLAFLVERCSVIDRVVCPGPLLGLWRGMFWALNHRWQPVTAETRATSLRCNLWHRTLLSSDTCCSCF